MVLAVFLSIATVCASDINQTDTVTLDEDSELSLNEDVELGLSDETELDLDGNGSDESQNPVKTSSRTTSYEIYTKDSTFNIQILDENGKGIAHKKVQVTFKGTSSNLTTNDKGYVFFKLTQTGTAAINYSFNEEGYVPISKSKTITVVADSTSTIKGKNYVAYQGASNPYTVTLSIHGVRLANKKVTFTIAGKKCVRKTNSKGVATLNINNVKKGKYTIKFVFNGAANVKAAKGSAKVTIKKGMPTSIVRQNSVTYKHNTYAPFIVKYKDVRGNPIASQTIIFTINGKSYYKKTNSHGEARLNIKQKTGKYTLKVNSYNTKVYKSSTNYYSIKVKSYYTKDNGFWLFGADMKKLDLKKAAKHGTKHIFLNYYAFELHGKSAVSDFACKAKDLGIKVHIWIQVFNNGDWLNPIKKDGSINYNLINSRIKLAKEYAAVKGVAGIHFDYLRFPGTAYKYKNGVKAVNYFTKEASNAVHKINPSLIVSAAVMPEPSANKYYYGQDIPTMTKYLDVIVPMVYKGNYNAGTSWIKSVTATLVKQSSGAKVWTGLQSYKSDSNYKKLSASTLLNDGFYAACGGATGVILFRYTYFDWFNFSY